MSHFTTRQLAALFHRPDWEVRRTVDRMTPPVERVGLVRVVPADRVDEVRRLLPAKDKRQEEPANA